MPQLPEPYINKINLKDYTQLLVEKLARVVFTNNSKITDYENEYSGNPLVNVTTLIENIEQNTEYTLPFSYTVGTNQLHITVSGYAMYPGVDYTEVGSVGSSSQIVVFNCDIEAGSVLGVVIYPNQISFGRNIIVNNGIDASNIKIVSTTANNAITNELGAFLDESKTIPDTSGLDNSKEYALEFKNGTVQWVEKS